MYYLYKEHAHAGTYYISKQPYKKKLEEKEGFCQQCYDAMMEIRKIRGKPGSKYEGKLLWPNYFIPHYDKRLAYQQETQDGINSLRATMQSDIAGYIKRTISVTSITKEQVDAKIAETGKCYLSFSIS